MNPFLMGAVGLAGVNSLLLLVLGAVWVNNYREFRSSLTLGLLAFAAVLLVENLVAMYFFFSMGSLYGDAPLVGEVVLLLRGMEFLALSFLTYVTTR